MRVVAMGARSAYEMGKMEHFLRLIDWSGLAGVVKERVEVRLFWAGTSREARSLMWRFLGRENQNNHARVHWSLSGALLLATRLQCHGLQIGE